MFFGEEDLFLQNKSTKNHTYNTKHTIYKRKEIKAKKKQEI